MLKFLATRRFLRLPAAVPSVTTGSGKRRLEFEQLESRELPAALAFLSPAAVYGAASLSGSTSANVRPLLSFNSGNLASKTSGGSQAYASLSNYSDASSYKTVTATTSAYTVGSTASSAKGIAQTTTGNGYNSVMVQVVASSYGETQGQAVQVTLTPRFVSTIGWANSGSASNSYSFYVNGQQYLGGTDSVRSTNPYYHSRTLTLNTTIGSTFRIAFQSESYAGFAGNGKSNTARMEFSLGMAVSTLGGGGGGSTSSTGSTGGGTGSTFAPPAAPSTPTWSSAGGKDIYLRWNDVAGETSYRVECWNRNTGQWVYLGSAGANVTSVKITNGYGYHFRIGATNSFGTNFSPFVLAQ